MPETQAQARKLRASRGRPRAEDAALKESQILAIALDLFLEKGFNDTKMEEIAKIASMSKRTLYSRFRDKQSLFFSAVEDAADRYTITIDELKDVSESSLEGTLMNVARLRLKNLATTEGTRLQRIIWSHSFQFPEFFDQIFRRTTGPTLAFLESLFTQHNQRGTLALEAPSQAAAAFLSLVLGGPARQITTGKQLSTEELEERLTFSVTLFLNGARKR